MFQVHTISHKNNAEMRIRQKTKNNTAVVEKQNEKYKISHDVKGNFIFGFVAIAVSAVAKQLNA